MMKRGTIKYFILKTLLACLPLAALVALYIVKDPFGMVHPYKELRLVNGEPHLGYNMGYVTVENFKKYDPQLHYDSFVFGSSMSQNYRMEFWKPHLANDAKPCHFDASYECIEGILNKMRFLNDHGTTIRNALIVIEENMFARTPKPQEFLYVQHPATTSVFDWPAFHYTFFKAYKNKLEVARYLLWPSRYEKKMLRLNILSSSAPLRIDDINEEQWPGMDTVIAKNPDAFFTPERLKANDIHPICEIEAPHLTPRNLELLSEMAQLLRENHTDFVVLIPPRYKRRVAHEQDLLAMERIFGPGRVFDFTRSAIGRDPKSYYDEPGHPVPSVCKQLLDSVYAAKRMNMFFDPRRLGL